MGARKTVIYALATVLMTILVSSTLLAPTFSAYATNDNHGKGLKDPDNDNDKRKCKQDKDIDKDQKRVAEIQAEILLDQGHVADIQAEILVDRGHVAAFQARIVQIQNDLALDQTDPIKNEKDIKEETKDLKDAQDDLAKEQRDITSDQADLAKEQRDIASDQADLAKEIADLNQDINNEKYNRNCDTEEDLLNNDPSTDPPSGQSTISVSTVDSSGKTISGYYTTLWQNGEKLESVFSPHSFTVNNGQTYEIHVAGFANYGFDHWSDGTTSRSHTVTTGTGTTTSLVAVYALRS